MTMSVTKNQNSSNALQSQTMENVEQKVDVFIMKKEPSSCVHTSSADLSSTIIDMRSYRKFVSNSERSFMGYDPDIIEDMVKRINELDARVKVFESKPMNTMKKSRPMIRVRD